MPVQDRIAVFIGEGAVEPTGQYSDEEVVRSSDEAQRAVEDPHVVCIDERTDAEEPQPIREKLAGGNLATGTFAAAAVGWSGLSSIETLTVPPVIIPALPGVTDRMTTERTFSGLLVVKNPEATTDAVADFLVDAHEPLGAHRHNTIQADNETGCGGVDKSARTQTNIKLYGSHPIFVENAKIDLGDLFVPDHWQRAIAGFASMADSPQWQKWRTSHIQEAVETRDGVVETLEGRLLKPEADPDNKRHNHWGEFARVNHRKGYSNDRDHATIPGFQVDVDPMVRMATKMAMKGEEEFSLLLHAMVLFQYGTTYSLTNRMRIIR